MIRRATLDDMDGLVNLARMEHGASLLKDTPFDVMVVQQRFASFITGFSSVVFVSEQGGKLNGVIAGIAQGNLHNRYATVYELMWFSVAGTGMKLLDALKAWANRMRATALVVHNYAGIKSHDTFNKVMPRKGFDTLGVSYTMKLEN